MRHIFKDSEVDVLTRNAEEVLQFHENFVEELRTAMTPFGFRMDLSSERPSDEEIPEASTENIDEGIAIVSTKFATEVSFVRCFRRASFNDVFLSGFSVYLL